MEKRSYQTNLFSTPRMAIFTPNNVVEVEEVTGGYLDGMTLKVTTEKGEKVTVYEYRSMRAAEIALETFEEHFKGHCIVCCL